MRLRIIALIALLATSWPHVVVLECVLGSAPTAGESGHHAMPSSEASPSHAEHAGASDSSAALASGDAEAPVGQQCAMVVACGLLMIRGEGATSALSRGGPPLMSPQHAIDAPQAAVLVGDPPPPRRST